jgi:hypothetical protein
MWEQIRFALFVAAAVYASTLGVIALMGWRDGRRK